MELPRAEITLRLASVVLAATLGFAVPAQAADTRVDGLLLPARESGIRARVEGTLQSILVRVGDYVRRDATVGRIANPRLDDDVRQAEAHDVEAEAVARQHRQVAQTAVERAARHRADLESALAQVEADRNLAARVIVARDLNDAKNLEQQRRRELRNAERLLDQTTTQSSGHALRERARANEELRAPFDGTVLALGPEPGSKVSPSGLALVTIAQLDPVLFTAQVAPDAFRFVPDQGGATVSVDELPGRQFAATISALNVVYSPPNEGLTVTISVSNPKGVLRPGMHAHAALQLSPLPQRPEVEGPQAVYAHR